MTIFLGLDILLIALLSLLLPIGWWRGPVKELYVTLGVLFGILLADYWARPWGRDLSDMTALTAGSGSFIVAWSFLVASTFILGYGLGATLYPAWHGWPARLLGAVVSALNGMLLLSFSLQYVRLFLLSDSNEESLEDSYVAQFLLDGIGWVLLLAAFFALPLLLYLVITGRRAYEPDYDDYDEEYDYDETYVEPSPVATRQRIRTTDQSTGALPPRVPATPRTTSASTAAAAYKADAPQRRRKPTAETRPLIVSEPQATAEPASVPHSSSADRMSDTDQHIIVPSQASDLAPSDTERPSPPSVAPVDDSGLAPGYTRCTNCHAVLSPDVSICPNCGTVK